MERDRNTAISLKEPIANRRDRSQNNTMRLRIPLFRLPFKFLFILYQRMRSPTKMGFPWKRYLDTSPSLDIGVAVLSVFNTLAIGTTSESNTHVDSTSGTHGFSRGFRLESLWSRTRSQVCLWRINRRVIPRIKESTDTTPLRSTYKWPPSNPQLSRYCFDLRSVEGNTADRLRAAFSTPTIRSTTCGIFLGLKLST